MGRRWVRWGGVRWGGMRWNDGGMDGWMDGVVDGVVCVGWMDGRSCILYCNWDGCIESYESRWMTLMRSAVTPMAVTAPPALCVVSPPHILQRIKATHPAPLTTNGFSPYLSV